MTRLLVLQTPGGAPPPPSPDPEPEPEPEQRRHPLSPSGPRPQLAMAGEERLVVSSKLGRVCLVEFNRPDALNAWVDDSFHHMRECL